MRGRYPYHNDVLILDIMLALKHAHKFQRIKFYFKLFMVYSFRGTSQHDSSLLLTKLVETCAQKYHFITPGTFAGI